MDPQFLLKDEVEFELASRGYIQPGGQVSALKLILKKMMHVENTETISYKIKQPRVSKDHPGDELEVCSNKLDTILRYVSELQEKPDRQLYRRLVSRLFHVINRLGFIDAVDELDKERHKVLSDKAVILLHDLEKKDDMEDDDEITPEMKDALHKSFGEDSKKILGQLGNNVILNAATASTSKSKFNDNLNREDGHKPNQEHRRVSFAHDDINANTFHERLSHLNVCNSTAIQESHVTRRSKLIPISQWGVQFSGDNTFSVNAFIERVNELKDARNATDNDLYRHAIDFFKGDALIWFRANRGYVRDWNELVLLLKRTFQSPFYQEELLAEAKSRTQGKTESVVIFVSVMQNLFNRLPNPINELEKIMIIVKNLQPYYQRAVCRDVFTSIGDLVNVLRLIERTKINCDNFQEPRILVNSIEPDLAYKSNQAINRQDTGEIQEIKQTNQTSVVKMRCWNCRESGHLFRACTMPKQRLFCYKCGRFGVTSKDCSCKGNLVGESQNSAS